MGRFLLISFRKQFKNNNMRVRFDFSEDFINPYTGLHFDKGFFIEFPCRVNKEDCFIADQIVPKELQLPDMSFWDNLEVECTRFDSDEQGIFQHVWFDPF